MLIACTASAADTPFGLLASGKKTTENGKLVGLHLSPQPKRFWVNRHVTDSSLEEVFGLTDLRSLNLSCCTKLTDDGLKRLKRLTRLESLDVSGCYRAPPCNPASALPAEGVDIRMNITSDGVKHLAALPNLRRLNLSHTRIDDNARHELAKMTTLRELYLHGTSISGKGLYSIRQALPKCKIHWTPPAGRGPIDPRTPGVLRPGE